MVSLLDLLSALMPITTRKYNLLWDMHKRSEAEPACTLQSDLYLRAFGPLRIDAAYKFAIQDLPKLPMFIVFKCSVNSC